MKRNPGSFASVALLSLAMLSGLVAQAGAAPGELELTTQRAVVFKDGYVLMIKRATGVADDQGRVFTEQVPDAAILGTFWVTSDKADASLRVICEFLNRWQRNDEQGGGGNASLSSLITAANGRELTVMLRDGRELSGRCLGTTQVGGQPHVMLAPNEGDGAVDAMLNVRTIPLANVASLGGRAVESVGRPDATFHRAKRLTVELGHEAAGKPIALEIMYFRPGIRWIPTYRLSGDMQDSTGLALQAELLNEAEDLDEVAVDLVVGVPNFRFRDVISPLSLEPALRNALQQVAPQLMGQMMANTFTQRASEWRGAGQPVAQPGAGDINLPSELAAAGEQDLYVYSLDKFSLRKGGRATVPLWRSQVPLRHLYTLDLHPVRNARTGSTSHLGRDSNVPGGSGDSPLRLMTNRFWHQFELSNTSKTPWTTGPAMILRDQLPLGQELLTYTAPGGKSLLPVTVAVDLRGSIDEVETERTPNALRWDNHSYSKISKAGTLTLTSYRTEPSECRITLSMGGKLLEASNDATVRINDGQAEDWQDGRYPVNNHSQATWDLTLAPGETVTLTYTCEFYLP